MKRKYVALVLTLFLLPILAACSPVGWGEQAAAPAIAGDDSNEIADAAEAPADSSAETDEEVVRPEGWTEETHGNDVEPNYDAVFPQDKVNQITITIDPADWEAMQADMTEILGEVGTGEGGGIGGFGQPPGDGDFTPPEGMEPPADFTPPAEGMEPPTGDFQPGQRPGGGGMGGAFDMVSETPMWVPATIEFDGNTWTNVGVRYKGNSSLTSAWRSGSLKMPFKFDFDEFEGDFPAIDNQRFFGFKQLSLANGFSDESYMRESVTYELMQQAGLVASETAFYEVILDYGEGPVNLGIYTVVEVIDDTVIENALGDNSGNIYEGDGAGVSLAEGTYDLIADSFEKENNEDEADWSDIEALYDALHAETRTTDPAQWRADLEAIFDVDAFLNWLAVSAVVQNWDTYGSMSHNFYLYNNPETGQLVWLPWDHNMTLGVGGGGGRGQMGGGPGGRGNVSFDKADVSEEWPLIRFLLDDPVYNEKYMGYLAAANDLFDAGDLTARVEAMRELLQPVIDAAGETAQFDTAVQQLLSVVAERDAAVADFLAAQ
jgi:hypothetical protein